MQNYGIQIGAGANGKNTAAIEGKVSSDGRVITDIPSRVQASLVRRGPKAKVAKTGVALDKPRTLAKVRLSVPALGDLDRMIITHSLPFDTRLALTSHP